MKIRIQNNTVRIRLNEREVKELQEGQELVSNTSFPENNLLITLRSNSSNKVAFIENRINIDVAGHAAKSWAKSDDVTLDLTFDTPNDQKLSILVEKDLKM